MKKHFFAAILALTALGASSCKKDPKLPTPSVEEFPLAFINISAQSTYKVTDIQAGNPTATFFIDVRGGDASQVESINIYRTFRGFNVPATGNPALGFGGPTLLLRSVPPTSGNISVTLSDMIAGLTRAAGPSQGGTRVPITGASLRANESFLITYDLLLKGGRRIEYNQSFNTAPLSGTITVIP
ncbi:hypothetical protein IC235_10040 [Hymenobacter sp. BT664]|uniref:Uncharacterized protein n=1 Tax=Hymenobacter montanus TaxID=2771359 RepID=A0A927BCF9_9BACT|nr:hypothetical protein [Hymenobacter montanus]MBD2768231.1 hypothetical protein [Hymenobacter montanus]